MTTFDQRRVEAFLLARGAGRLGMGPISYNDAEAAAFQATRHLTRDGLAQWRDAVARYLAPRPGMRLLDLGAGTGMWAVAFTDWYGIEVVAVEPSEAMRARSSYPGMLVGHASAIPLEAASVDGAWLSTVIHHIPDLRAAATELRRVLRLGAPVLIRSAFPGRHEQITLFRFFPEAIRVLDTYSQRRGRVRCLRHGGLRVCCPGTRTPGERRFPQDSGRSATSRRAHPLKLLTDEEYETGLARLQAAADTDSKTSPVVDALDLLILRKVEAV